MINNKKGKQLTYLNIRSEIPHCTLIRYTSINGINDNNAIIPLTIPTNLNNTKIKKANAGANVSKNNNT